MDKRNGIIRKRKSFLFPGRRIGHRITAVLLVLAMLLQLLPGTAREAEASSQPAAAGQEKEIGKFSKVGSGQSKTDTYILEVSSGTKSGGGAAENVLYFAVYYTTTDGMKRTAILLPTEDALTNSLKQAADVASRSSRVSLVKNTFEYENQSYSDLKALGSVKTDQFIFTSQGTVKSFDRIQIFGKKTSSESTWTCQGLRIHRVDTLYGLDMAGWFSSTYYIDYAGEMVAEAVMNDGSGLFRWNNSGGCKTITGIDDRSGLSDIILVNASEAALFRDMYPRLKTNVGMKHKSQADNILVVRIDFADQSGAGFESLAGSYEAGSRSKISDLAFCETAYFSIQYTDLYGSIREVKLPFMINALGQVAEALGNVAIAGYAQQGDSVAVPLMLPDYAELNYLGIQIGSDTAREATDLRWGTSDTNKRSIYQNRVSRSESDGIDYTCVALYRDVKTTVSLAANSATLQYKFTPGMNNPVQYSTATSTLGLNIPAKQLKYITLQDYSSSMVLAPTDRGERYLITVYTDDVVNAGTADSVYMQLHYVSLKGKELVSDPYDMRKHIQQFYGEWAGNVNEFAYQYGMRQGGMAQFVVQLQGVREFTDVSFRIDGDDEWQISGLTIAMLNSYEGRTAVWKEIASSERDPSDQTKARLLSHLEYSREVNTDRVCFELGMVPDPDHPVVPGDKNWEPGTLIQDGGDWTIISGDGGEVTTKEDVDWGTLSHYMTFADTQQDLGFTKQRAVYTVTVKVAGDKVATGADRNPVDDDCGSANLFYFQLIFANGASGVTLANQQIVGDAFRTGTEVSFKIPTSQDYGDLISIVVIPDDQDSNSNIYDKLKIEYITVSKESNAALTPSWAARGDAEDGLGWVGIEYRDPAEYATKQGAEGRTLSEIATTYQITETGYTAKLMVSITTGPYSQTTKYDEHLNPTTIIDPAFAGGVSMTYSYFNSDGRLKTAEGIDIIKAMNEYMGRPGSMTRTYQDGTETVTEEVDYYVSDPKYQFRAGHTDNFFITANDIWQILDMQLVIRSSVVTKWNISKVSVYLVKGSGKRYINANGEYSYYYAKGEEPKLVAVWNRAEDQILSKDVQTYRTIQENSIAEINISFLDNEIPLDKATLSWASVIPREPNSKNDTLNLYLYPETGGSAASLSDYTLSAAIRFTDETNLVSMQSSAGELRKGVDINGQTVLFAVGINANNMDALSGVDVLANARKTISAPIRYGILQRIRGGVLIETYYLSGVNNASLGGTMHAVSRPEANNTQRVFLQLPLDMPAQQLKAEEQDLAVALYFTPAYPDYQELRSKYIYLSDMGYTSVRPGQLLELDFDIGEISEVTAVNVVRLGSLNIPIEHAYIVNQQADGLVVQEHSIRPRTTPGSSPTSMPFNGKVGLLLLALETAADEDAISSGTNGPIRMTVGYYDEYGAVQEKVYDDIRPYIEAGNSFKAGGTDMIRLLVPGLAETLYVDLEPWDEAETLASWKLSRVTAVTGVDGNSVVRSVNQRIMEEEPVRVFLTDVILIGTVNVLTPQEEGDPVSEKQGTVGVGETMGIVIDSGQQVDIPVRVSGSDEGVTADVKIFDPELNAEKDALLDAVSDYDREYVEKVYKQAKLSYNSATSTEEERAAAEKVMTLIENMNESDGDLQVSEDGKSVLFIPPRNFGAENIKYLLYVSSAENPDSKFLVEVTVHTEASELAQAIAEWNSLRTVSDAYVIDPDGNVKETEPVENEGTLSLIIESGDTIMVEPKLSEGRSYTTSVVEIFENGSEGKPDFGTTHNYTDSYLAELYSQASASYASEESSPDEKKAAQKLMDLIDTMRGSLGLFDHDEEYLRLVPPRNYTGGKLKYRIDFFAEETEEEPSLTFSVLVTVRPEADMLQDAYENWKAIRSGGKVDILDADETVYDTQGLVQDEAKNILISSGDSIKAYPRIEDGTSFTASLYSYDPATGASGRASLEPTHGFTDAQLSEMEAYANEVLSIKGATDGEKTAAQKVLDLIADYRSSGGSYSASAKPITLVPPRNYTGSNLYYRIVVTAAGGETLATIIVSVQSEENALAKAYSTLQSVHNAADESSTVQVRIIHPDGSLDETQTMPKKTTLNMNLSSGEGVQIASRYYSREGYTVSLRTYPVTSTPPSMSPDIGYTESQLDEMESFANSVLNTAGATDLEKQLAQTVLDDIAELRSYSGSFDGESDPAVFIPPHNFTGERVGYQISVNQGNEWLAIIVITVDPEEYTDTLTGDYEALLEEWNIIGTFRVLDSGGHYAGSGDLYADNSTKSWDIVSHGSVILTFKDRFNGLLNTNVDRSLNAIHPYWAEFTVQAYRDFANETLALPDVTPEETEAANELLEAIDYVFNSSGSVTVEGSVVTFRLPVYQGGPRTSSGVPFVLTVGKGSETVQTVNVTLGSRDFASDPILQANKTLREIREKTLGHLSILDENDAVVSEMPLRKYESESDAIGLTIQNGQTVKFFFRDDAMTSSEGLAEFTDPDTLVSVSAYDQQTLDEMRAFAYETLAIDGVTAEETAAANKVLADIAAVEKTSSISHSLGLVVTYTGVYNYQGTLNFTITIGTTPMGALDGSMTTTLVIVNCTQPAGEDPLIVDYPALVAARAAGDDERAAAATTEPETTEPETTEPETTEAETTEPETTEAETTEAAGTEAGADQAETTAAALSAAETLPEETAPAP